MAATILDLFLLSIGNHSLSRCIPLRYAAGLFLDSSRWVHRMTTFVRPRNDGIPIRVHAHVAVAERDGEVAFPRLIHQALRQPFGQGFGPANFRIGKDSCWGRARFAVGSDGNRGIHLSRPVNEMFCTPASLYIQTPEQKTTNACLSTQ